ncbi:DegT/DnrJ/EryC1/StrS family aminotransferase [Candidatus Microgenomates bacterium]|nr:DegT/DnrJ/EryC1/StrS family aminotransferase [Candidatus Microgenomates bacterium]
MIFNSLGSNYNFNFVLKALFTANNQSYLNQLKVLLEKKYSGKVILTNKGRESIEMALTSYPITYAVGITGFTCFAVFEAVVKSGRRPVFVDLEKNSLNFSARTLKITLAKNPDLKIVLLQNTLGFPCNLTEIEKACKKNNLILIEDLAHSAGTIYPNQRPAGTVGDFSAFSFSQDKMIDGVTGGALIIRNIGTLPLSKSFSDLSFREDLLNRFYPLLTYLIRKTYFIGAGKILHHILKTFNLLSQPMTSFTSVYKKLPPWNAALIRQQLEKLSDNIKHRQKISLIYLKNLPPELTVLVDQHSLELSSCVRFPVLVKNRASLIQYLKTKGIYLSDIWYDGPIAPKKYLNQTNYKRGDCPIAEKIADQILNLPTHSNTNRKQALYISGEIKKWLLK